MGVCASQGPQDDFNVPHSAAESFINKNIERQQRNQAQVNNSIIKLLILGTGDSGKTTLRKQMRNVYGMPYNEQERSFFISSIFQNLIEGCMAVIKAMDGPLGIKFASAASRTEADKMLMLKAPFELNDTVAASLAILLRDADFNRAVSLRSHFQLQDCWDGFAKSCLDYPRWGGPNWIPTTAECISSRIRTSGIIEEMLTIGTTPFKLYDVGGQRSERRKWIHSFDVVNAIIFVTGISEYDLVLFEDVRQNRLLEAFELFREVSSLSFFQSIPIMLFLNKRDLFEDKFMVKKIPLNVSGKFPDAPDEVDLSLAYDWIISRFKAVKGEKSGTVFTHITVATDPANVRRVVDDVSKIMIKSSLEGSGFV